MSQVAFPFEIKAKGTATVKYDQKKILERHDLLLARPQTEERDRELNILSQVIEREGWQ